ncbi:MAG: DegQ family serine endoprotease [Gallionella sp.]|nr:DegQ family serine endoprotease [Gallionella sp.]MDD4958503.1 DegQ family serine endoprotease [Gallionella sp.]
MLKKLAHLLLILSLLMLTVVQAKELPDFTILVEQHSPAVVNISTTQISRNAQGFPNLPEGDPFFEFFRRFAPQMPREQESQSLGSGFIISSDGYILTNAHVVDSAEKIMVRLTDKREFQAKVIGADKRTDVAVLKIEATGLPKMAIGDPSKLKVGEWVIAIGSPFGFDSSVTAGIVSAKGRTLPKDNLVSFIQTDVAINPGNSGGPLFNMAGEVVGINSQIYTRSGGSMGLSFAIPIDVAMQVSDQLRRSGKVTRGRIGVTIQSMTLELAESFGLSEATGALISDVEKDGAADKAGIEASDVVLKFDGKIVNSSEDLPRLVAASRPGSKVVMDLWHKGALKKVTVQIAKMSDESKPAPLAEKTQDGAVTVSRLGVAVSDPSPDEAGLTIEEVKSNAARAAGLQAGDVLVAIGNIPLRSVKQLNEILKPVAKGRNVALLIRRSDRASYLAIKLDEK